MLSAAGTHARLPVGLFATYSYHAFITDREGDTLELEADHRRHAEIENAIRDLKYGVGLNHLPSGRFPANAAWMAIQIMAHNLARWTTRIGLGEPVATAKTLRRRFFSLPDGSPARRGASPCICPRGGPGKINSAEPWRDCAPCHSLPDGVRPVRRTTQPPGGFAPGRSRSVSGRKLAAGLTRHQRCGPSEITFARQSHPAHPSKSIGIKSL